MEDDRRQGSPDRRDGSPGWRDLNNAMHELREEFQKDIAEVRQTMAEGFERVDYRIVWAVTVLSALLAIGVTIAIALMK